MKRLSSFFTIVFLILLTLENSNAQQYSNDSWIKIISLHFGYALGSNDWEYSHPLYTGTGVQTIREPGSFKAKLIFNGEFELLKGYFGFSAGTGILPAEIKVDKTEKTYSLNSIFIELSGMFFPLGNPYDKIVPLLKIGGGGIKSSGDLDNTSLFITLGAGVRTFFDGNFGASLMIKGCYLTYSEIPLDENVTGDMNVTPFTISIGALYKF